MRNTMLASGTRRAALGVFLAAMMVATLLAPVAQQSAAAQDDLAIQTRVLIMHASPMGKVEVHINYDEIVDEFTYGQVSDWTDFTPGAPESRLPQTGRASTTPSSTRSTRLPPATTTTWSSARLWSWPAPSTAPQFLTAAHASPLSRGRSPSRR